MLSEQAQRSVQRTVHATHELTQALKKQEIKVVGTLVHWDFQENTVRAILALEKSEEIKDIKLPATVNSFPLDHVYMTHLEFARLR